jgi:hypothetical protein
MTLRSPFVRDTALSHSGKLLAVAHGGPYPMKLSVLDIENNRWLAETLIASGGSGSDLAWSPDDSRIASVQKEAVVEYSWPRLDQIWSMPMTYPSAVEYSPQGDRLAIGSWNAGVVVRLSTDL